MYGGALEVVDESGVDRTDGEEFKVCECFEEGMSK